MYIYICLFSIYPFEVSYLGAASCWLAVPSEFANRMCRESSVEKCRGSLCIYTLRPQGLDIKLRGSRPTMLYAFWYRQDELHPQILLVSSAIDHEQRRVRKVGVRSASDSETQSAAPHGNLTLTNNPSRNRKQTEALRVELTPGVPPTVL
jgi:hypothetical protein